MQRIGRNSTRGLRAFFALTLIAALIGLLSTSVGAQVAPGSSDITLAPGESADPITKTITIPNVPARAEICLVADVSGSFRDDVSNLQAQASAISALADTPGSDVTLGLATFADYPIGRFGDPSDEPYTLVTPLTTSGPWETAVNTISADGGNDTPESQLDAIVGAAIGLTVDSVALPSCGWAGAVGTTKIIIATTDASCHEPGAGKPHQNSTAATVATLVAQDITFIGLASGDNATACFQPLADGTGGVVEPLTRSGDNITTAINNALVAIDFDLTPTPMDCDGLTITFDPPSIAGLAAGDTVTFTEIVTLDSDTSVSCAVQFGPAGDQLLSVTAEGSPAPPTPAATATPVPVFVAPIPTPVPESLTIDNQVVGFPPSTPFSYLISPEVEGCSLPQRLEISGTGGQIGASVITASETTGEACTYSVVQDPKMNYATDVGAYGGVAPDGFVRFINTWTGGATAPAPSTDSEVLGAVATSEPLAHTGGDTDIATIGFYFLALGTAVAGASRIKRRRS